VQTIPDPSSEYYRLKARWGWDWHCEGGRYSNAIDQKKSESIPVIPPGHEICFCGKDFSDELNSAIQELIQRIKKIWRADNKAWREKRKAPV